MMITIAPYQQQQIHTPSKKTDICFKMNPNRLKDINIGLCPEGFIGKVRVRKSDNSEGVLNVFKKFMCNNGEQYTLQNDRGDVFGVINLAIKKFEPVPWNSGSNPDHVFVDKLRNYSNPNTPYYKNLEYHKDIGIRLMQIAQKRSDEAMCGGNIKLISKNESKNWYKSVIMMTEEFPPMPNCRFRLNPNAMYLPPESKERLAWLNGGL